MANRGWDSDQSGQGWPSNATTHGEPTGVGNAESFVRGSQIADPGEHNDPMDSRSDLFEPPGQLSTC